MGMQFKRRTEDARKKEHAPKEQPSPYKLATYEHDHEGKKLKSSKVCYSFWSASKYVLILSLMLWWLPMFGQMIAGYVGGRRAGGPWKGVAASILPVVCLYAVVTGFDTGLLPSHAFGVAIAPAAIGSALTHNIPLLSPYLEFSSEYVGSFVKGLEGASPYGINVYVLTIAFAYVGGVLAEQNRREIEYSAGAVTSTTTVLVHDPYAHHRAEMPIQEQQPARARGVIAGLGGLFHRGSFDQPATAAMYGHRRHKDPWAGAAQMRYGDDEPAYDDGYALPPMDSMQVRDDYEYGSYQTRSRRKHKRDGWYVPQKRRGRPNYSAKPRFNYPQYEYNERPEKNYNYSSSGGWRRSQRSSQNYSVSTDPKSIRRAKRMIDKEWGGSRYPSYSDVATERGDEIEQVAHHNKKDHGPSHNWDSV